MPTSANQSPPTRSAPLWRRFAALGYDSLILMALSMGYGALITSVKVALGTPGQDYQPMLHSPLYFLGWLLVLVSFFLYSWCRSGQTIGMRAWRIQLIPQDSAQRALSIKQALARCLFGSLSMLALGAGYWYGWFNPEGNTWHDAMTQSRVIVIPK
ncbi:MAG TPA: RDD family protein [Cellvibrionaceae bacterium]|nr:RDD family protein [Cellvibrionaceae bacterium]